MREVCAIAAIELFFLIGHMYLIVVWLDKDQRVYRVHLQHFINYSHLNKRIQLGGSI